MPYKGKTTKLTRHWRFFKRYLSKPSTVGAVGPSSDMLAAALCEPLCKCARPARILEIGAGTGAVTQHIGMLMSDHDELDICEIEPEFASILRRDVLSRPVFASAVEDGRVRLLEMPVQDLSESRRYDFVVSGLPLTVFELRDVRNVFSVIRRCLKPGGILSYFEYVGMRRTSRLLSVGKSRRRIRMVSAYLSKRIRNHQIDRRTVLMNLPPAHARHLRFDRTPVLSS
ncbi:MAG: methyltransferase domain-containing protein [Phycisphaerales bacterium]|nr:MAG: methyltransferase domain-containing protein [Phycisphaerales bacterium]